MKVKKMNKFVLFITNGFAAGITLVPFGIYIKEKYYNFQSHKMIKKLINHERIHERQQKEMLIIPFYIWYLLEWLVRLITNPGNAYKSISFEREAKENEHNKEYLEKREKFSWIKYI